MPLNLQAQTPLNFRDPENRKEKQIYDFSIQNNNLQYVVAKIDLNNDFIDEYILKPKFTTDCPNAPLCPHIIAAFQDRKPIIIGQFDAHKILISNKKTYGIQDIIVYNKAHNDFQSSIAVWSPFNFRFELR